MPLTDIRRRLDNLEGDVRHLGAHPHLVALKDAQNIQQRVADWITARFGSMMFVYFSTAQFIVWVFLIEKSPWQVLTLVVSLEAIYLAAFVLISQNRADQKRQVVAAAQWAVVQEEKTQNEQLLEITATIHQIAQEIHTLVQKET